MLPLVGELVKEGLHLAPELVAKALELAGEQQNT